MEVSPFWSLLSCLLPTHPYAAASTLVQESTCTLASCQAGTWVFLFLSPPQGPTESLDIGRAHEVLT